MAFVVVLAALVTGCGGNGASSAETELTARVTELEETVAQAQATIDECDAALEEATHQLTVAEQQVADLEEQLHEAEAARDEATAARDEAAAREQEMRGVLDDNLAAIEAERNAFLRELAQLRETARLPDTPQVRDALAALTDFLSAMRSGRYDDAAALYSGSYEAPQEWNPTVDPNDHEALLEAACGQLLCTLEVKRVLPGLIDGDTYSFYLEFTQDGEPFSLGPCCGDDSTEPQTQFLFQVNSTDDGYKVLTLPVYTP